MKKRVFVFVLSILLTFGVLHMMAYADFGDYEGTYDFGGSISSNRVEDDYADDAPAEYRYDYVNDDSYYNHEKQNNTFSSTSNRSASGSRRSVGMIISIIVGINVILILVFLIRRR